MEILVLTNEVWLIDLQVVDWLFRDVPYPGAVWPPAHLRVGQGPEEGESLILPQAEQAELQARDAHAHKHIILSYRYI